MTTPGPQAIFSRPHPFTIDRACHARKARRLVLKGCAVMCVLAVAWMAAGEESPAQSTQGILLKSGDIVGVNVFGEPSLSGAFPVSASGTIVFPLLGGIPATGLSPDDLAAEIKARLEADYIREAQVAVAIAETAALPPNTVTVIGQVMRPGQVAFEAGGALDLFTAIASAGGLTERANRSRIELKRREGGDLRSQILSLDANRVLALQDTDTLIVHAVPEVVEREEIIPTVTVIGEVRNPGQIPMRPGQPLDVIAAIAMAGGFTDTARPSRVVVRRVGESGVQTYELNVSRMQRDQSEPFLLAPNDTITVPQSIF